VKSLDHHALRARLAARAALVATARDLANQLRGFLRGFGLIVGKAKRRFERSRPSSWCKFGDGSRWPWVRPPGVEVGVARRR
jgi:transposase